jgi:serine/threonine protein kinase
MDRISQRELRPNNPYEEGNVQKINASQPEYISKHDIAIFEQFHEALKDGRLGDLIDEKDIKLVNRKTKISEGGFGNILDVKVKDNKNVNVNIVAKVPVYYGKKLTKDRVAKINKNVLGEQRKANNLRRKIKKAIVNGNLANAQALNNVVVPFKVFQVDENGLKALLMRKADGNDGIKAINDGKIEGYSEVISLKEKELNDKKSDSCKLKKYHFVDDRKVALSVARQKAMLLRGLHECGYVNIDTKLENIMISKNGVVSMIDVGSIVKTDQKNNFSFSYTKETVAPEVLKSGYEANAKADVFSDAVDRPLILFGQVAEKYFDGSNKKLKSIKSTAYSLQNKLKEYKKLGFDLPKFPENFTDARKMRYMYYHLGFKKIQKELVDTLGKNAKTRLQSKKAEMVEKNIYPDEVLHSLALLQTYATEPDPRFRISDREVEEILLNLEMTSDLWNSGQFRIKDRYITLYSLVDRILPKNRQK